MRLSYDTEWKKKLIDSEYLHFENDSEAFVDKSVPRQQFWEIGSLGKPQRQRQRKRR